MKPSDYIRNCDMLPTCWNALCSFSISYRTVKADVLPKFNELDGRIDRRSHEGIYEVVNGLPRYSSAGLHAELGARATLYAALPILMYLLILQCTTHVTFMVQTLLLLI